MDQNKKRQVITLTSDACSNMIVNIRQLRLSVLDLFNTLADGGVDSERIQQLHLQQQATNHGVHSHHHPSHAHHGHHGYHHQQHKIQAQSSSEKLFHQQTLSSIKTSHALCSSSIPSRTVQRQLEIQQQTDLIQYVNQMIGSITGTIRSLDQDIGILMQNYSLINTGETIHLGLDGSLDKHNLYMDLCLAYKNYAKLQDYSMNCHALLHQQSLKRVHKQTIQIGPNQSNNSQHQQQQQQQARTIESSHVANFNPYIHNRSFNISRAAVTNVLEQCLKKCDYMEGTYSQPFGMSTGVLQISVNRVLKAILLMRGMVIDAVIVKAYHESFAMKKARRGDGGFYGTGGDSTTISLIGGSQFVDPDRDDIDLWSESKYNVFRRLTHHANAAVLHFQYPTYPEIAVKSFLVSKQSD